MALYEMKHLLAALVVFGCLISVSSENAPECQDLQKFANQLKSMALGMVTIDCTPLKNCSGLQCNGKAYTKDFSITLLLQHCSDPVRILMHFSLPGSSIDEWKAFESGKKTDILKNFRISFLQISASVTPVITKQGNIVNISGVSCASSSLTPSKCLPIPVTSVRVSSLSCENGTQGKSTETPKSGPTPKPAEQTTSKAGDHTTPKNTEKLTSPATSAKVISSTGGKKNPTTGTQSTAKQSKSTAGKKVSTGKKKPGPTSHTGKRKHKADQEKGLSTGAKVAIGTSAILVIVLILGLFLYWRKLMKRRPAYYNDILTNRDSMQGFDDEEPLFDSHLVL